MAARFAWSIIRWGFFLLIASSIVSFLMIYPYRMEVQSLTSSLKRQLVYDGYFSSDYRKYFEDKMRSENGMLGNATLTPGKKDAGKLFSVFGTPDDIVIEAYYQDSNTFPATQVKMTPISESQRDGYVETALASGTPPSKTYLVDRDTVVTVKVKTNFKVTTIIFGKELVAYLPMGLESTGIVIKDFRW